MGIQIFGQFRRLNHSAKQFASAKCIKIAKPILVWMLGELGLNVRTVVRGVRSVVGNDRSVVEDVKTLAG